MAQRGGRRCAHRQQGIAPAPEARRAWGARRGHTRRAQLGVASLCGAALVACAGPGQGTGQGGAPAPGLAPATVTYAFLGNPVFLQMNQEAGREFEAAHPGLKLELAHMPTGMYDKIQNLYAGGVAPDVWEPDAARFPAWAERGSFADVTAMARRDQGRGST